MHNKTNSFEVLCRDSDSAAAQRLNAMLLFYLPRELQEPFGNINRLCLETFSWLFRGLNYRIALHGLLVETL